MSLLIKNPGLLTTIQDLGRPGYFHLGIPMSGAMDQFACKIANLLVGNEITEAVLESVFMGPEIEFKKDCVIAVTGAEMTPIIDGVEHDTWSSIAVKAGQILSFSRLKKGARIYIAISGGIDVPLALGSRSTYIIGSLGGYNGRSLLANDELMLGEAKLISGDKYLSENLRRTYDTELQVVPGLYWHRVTEDSGKKFFNSTWKVAPESDRMGYRFKGDMAFDFTPREQPFGAGSDPSNIVDACYPYGSIQVPSGKEPIILHRDAVSGGGYFMIGTVISADMDLIAQMQPHTEVQFKSVTLDEALLQRTLRQKQFEDAKNFILK